MANLLRGVQAKIGRANELLTRFDLEVDTFAKSNPAPYSVTREWQNDSKDYVFIAKKNCDVPDRFAVLAGEIIHHLASALDHLFCALVLKNEKQITKRHYFPIYTSADTFTSKCNNGILDDISQSAQQIIKDLQPCMASEHPDHTIFAVLKELNNRDKHRLLVVLAGGGVIGETVVVGASEMANAYAPIEIIKLGEPRLIEITEAGSEYFRIGLAHPTPQFTAQAELAFSLVFKDVGPLPFISVHDALNGMISAVAHAITQCSGEFAADD